MTALPQSTRRKLSLLHLAQELLQGLPHRGLPLGSFTPGPPGVWG